MLSRRQPREQVSVAKMMRSSVIEGPALNLQLDRMMVRLILRIQDLFR